MAKKSKKSQKSRKSEKSQSKRGSKGKNPRREFGSKSSSRPTNGSGSGFYPRGSVAPQRSNPQGQSARNIAIGTVKRHPDGFGFLIPEDKNCADVYVPRHLMDGVMTGDKLNVRFERERGTDDRLRASDVEIITRSVQRVVGRYSSSGHGGMILDESHGWGANVLVPKEFTMGAAEGQLVAAEIVQYPTHEKPLTGKVISIIGSSENPMTDIERVIHAQNLPYRFSAATEREAEQFPAEVDVEENLEHRKDLRAKKFVTIDGVTAKDFDDAIFVEANKSGFRMWVAIADVSHYVKPGSAIDKDAYERGTSSYFPNFVVPMLPEVLSNELCSLKPHVPRLTLVAEMQFSFEGQMLESHFYEAIIQSKARVTYGEAQEIIDDISVEKLNHVYEDIKRAADLAKILLTKRMEDGSLDLEMPETVLEVDASGVPVDMVRSERLFSHRMIEELMLAANIATAKFLSSHEVPALYRIHESPDPEAIQNLEKFIFSFGGRKGIQGGKLQKKLTRAIQEMHGGPYGSIISMLTLRSMKQAKYSHENVGHFGLAFDFYSHFTSPIRRYPDLIVHRLVKACLKIPGYRLMSEDDVATSGVFLSACEQRSVKAERLIVSIKKARFAVRFIGQTMEGMISSVTKFGIFVVLREYDVDGLVKVESLGREKFEFSPEHMRLRGTRSGTEFKIGDAVNVVVTASDPETGQIDFILAESLEKIESVTPTHQRVERPEFEPRSFDRRPQRVRGSDLFTVARRGINELKSGDYAKAQSDRTNREERGKATDNRGRVRKARFSKRR